MPLNLVSSCSPVIVQSSIINHFNLQEREDTWEDDNSVSESSSIYHPDHSDGRIRAFNNPHYSDEYSGSNPDGKLFHLSANTK